MACAHSTSRAVSRAQRLLTPGVPCGVALISVASDNPKLLLKVCRSEWMEGWSYASTMAIVWPVPSPETLSNPYACLTCAGDKEPEKASPASAPEPCRAWATDGQRPLDEGTVRLS